MIKHIITIFTLFSFSIYAAIVGENITNKAYISYTISGVEKNITTNEVNTTIAKTTAKINFFTYTQDGVSQTIEPNYYLNSNGEMVQLQYATLSDGSTIIVPNNLFLQPTTNYLPNDLIIVKVTDLDQNINKDKRDTITIELTNPSTNDKETLLIKESTPNSGEFIGFIQGKSIPAKSGDGILSLGVNDNIYAIYNDDQNMTKVRAYAKIINQNSTIFVQKSSLKKSASIGEFVPYTITIENKSQNSYSNLTLYDLLPPGLKYIQNSLTINGKKAAVTLSKNGKLIQSTITKLPPKTTLTVSLIAIVTPLAKKKVTNKAWIQSLSGRSNIAKATIKIKKELFQERGYIVGKVIDNEKKGVEGIRIYLEDGRYTITDKKGRYHFIDIANGTHVVQIDTDSLPKYYKAKSCEENTRFAGSNISQFVTIYHGEIARANFCLQKKVHQSKEKFNIQLYLTKIASTIVQVTLQLNNANKLENKVAIFELSKGLEVVKNSLAKNITMQKDENLLAFDLNNSNKLSFQLRLTPSKKAQKVISVTLFYTQNGKKEKSQMLAVSFQAKGEQNQEIASFIAAKDSLILKNDFIKENKVAKSNMLEDMPKYSAQDIDQMGSKAKFIWPPKNWVPHIPSTKVAILLPKDCFVQLKLNGKKVDMVHYEGIIRSKNKKMRIIHFKGIDLYNGKNEFEAIIKKGKKVVATLHRRVYVENGAPAFIEFLPQYSYLQADGKHNLIVAVRFRGKSGHPLRGGMVGSFSVKGGYEALIKSNNKGKYTIASNGIAYIQLKPTLKVGTLTLDFGNNLTLTTDVKPYLRDWIVVGFAKGTLEYSSTQKDKKLYHNGQIAFFAKGKVFNKWLLTLAYNNKKSKRALFDTVDPKEFYTLFNDASIQKNEAPSQKKLYCKLERENFYALFGDFYTNITGTKFLNYQRSFTGFKSRYKKGAFRSKIFITKSSKEFVRDDIKADGSNGYYYLSKSNILEGSERVTLEIHDRKHLDKVLQKISLTRYKDYDIDYEDGKIYFKNPIFSVDKNFNPVYIVAKYEIEKDSQSHFTYGSELSYKKKNFSSKAVFIHEDNGLKKGSLYGINIKAKISKKIETTLEFAHSKNKIEKEQFTSNAFYSDFSYHDKNISATFYYQKVGKGFGLGQENPFEKALLQYGFRFEKKANKFYYSLQAYQEKRFENNQTNTIKVAEFQSRYDLNNSSINLGIRSLKEDKKKWQSQLIFSVKKSYFDGNLTLLLSHEQTLFGSSNAYPTRTTLKSQLQYDKKTKLFFQLERSKINNKSSYLFLSGLNYKPSPNTLFKYSTQYEANNDQETLFQVYSIERIFTLNKFTKVKLSYQREDSLEEKKKNSNTFTAQLDYSKKKLSLNLQAQYQNGSEKRTNLNIAAYYKKSYST